VETSEKWDRNFHEEILVALGGAIAIRKSSLKDFFVLDNVAASVGQRNTGLTPYQLGVNPPVIPYGQQAQR
jgi:hypothetical protein